MTEWSATVWHFQKLPDGTSRKAHTREGNFKTWQIARLWVIDRLRNETGVTYAEVCYVETKPGSVPRKREDVAVIKFIPQYGTFTEQQRKQPWFKN